MNLPTLITPAQAAQTLQIPESRLARWRSKGVGPDYVKIEGRVSYTIDAVCEFLKRSTVRFERNGVLAYDDESN